MAFKPTKNQNYYIVPKFIDPEKDGIRVLGSAGTGLGVPIQSQALTTVATDVANQQFRFDPGQGGRYYWVLLHNANYLAVHASMQTDGAPIIHWQWQPGSPNLYFEFFPAGDGYYRIMASHSQKFLDVLAFNKASGAQIVQHSMTGANNQLFKLVPVPNQALSASPVSFAETNNWVRTGILGVLSAAPKIGAGLKFVVALFWTEPDKLGDFWNQMKSYVDTRVRALILEQRLKDMTDMLVGFMNLLKEISAAPGLKGDELKLSVINAIVLKEPSYLKKTVELLPYIVGMGTIMITLRRSMVVDFETLYGRAPTAEELTNNKSLLKEAITKYTKAVNDCVAEAMVWRMGQIPARLTVDDPHTVKKTKWTNHTSYAQDNYDGWRKQWWCRTGHQPDGIKDHRARADYAIDQRRRQVEVQFASEMNEFVRASRFWQFFDPAVAPYTPVRVIKEVGIFGGRDATNRFASTDGKKITDIYFHWWNGGNLCGFELYMDGVTMGVQGCRGNQVHHMQLAADEYINSVEGFDNGNITGLWFSTHKGKIGGGGSVTGSYFSGDIADSFNAKLVKITGANDGGTLQQISFTWEYMD